MDWTNLLHALSCASTSPHDHYPIAAKYLSAYATVYDSYIVSVHAAGTAMCFADVAPSILAIFSANGPTSVRIRSRALLAHKTSNMDAARSLHAALKASTTHSAESSHIPVRVPWVSLVLSADVPST